ncbi:hypothetical protein [Burkholderia cepacia]|uniref:hypothetical protein n=1 Tax=Burkholderia cepacia TaxID=292 RepID=UPI000B0B8806|nr:hypothetical protein [Burkholderia cepacia]
MSLRSVIASKKNGRMLVASCLIGLALGLATLTLPYAVTASQWTALVLGIVLKIKQILAFSIVALLCCAGVTLPTRYHNNRLLSAGARVAAKIGSGLSLRVAMFLVGLNLVVLYSRDWHAFSAFLTTTIWLSRYVNSFSSTRQDFLAPT